ncbi:MAG: two-component regulator propeller domain-containing protein [Candidatus Aminicenantes bacterium]|jgi:ligand-binding sensor domain-containing protein/signal transduction histidine kinase/CheY-like chemotaxis protein
MFCNINKRKPGVTPFLVYFFILIFTLLGPVFGQHYNFRNYSVEQGLAVSQLFTLVQCRHGYLWIGTYGGGLSRFDGQNFTNYSTKDGLSDNSIYSIIEDRQGNLWLGTDIGLNKYDGKSFTPYPEKDVTKQKSIRVIFEDQAGDIWFGTYEKGLGRLNLKTNRFSYLTTSQGLASNHVSSITPDRQGNLLIGTSRGLSKYDGTRFVNCRLTEGLEGYNVRWVLLDRSGHSWFATNKGIRHFDGNTFTAYTTRDGLCDDQTLYIIEDSSGYLWFATMKGVSRFDSKDQTFSNYTTRQGLMDNYVDAIFEDREGNFWFATDKGLSKFSGKTFTYFNTKDGLKGDSVWTIWEEDQDVMYLVTEGYVSRYDRKESSIVNEEVKWPGGFIYPWYEDRAGNVWFGTGKEIIKYDRQVYTNLSEEKGLEDLHVFSIFEDSRGHMWFGTETQGARKYDDKTFSPITSEDGLVDNTVHVFSEDIRGNIWMGTDEGISIYNDNNKEFINITTSQWLTNKYVLSILKDQKNNFWIGTYGAGVIKYTPAPKPGKDMYTTGVIETFTTSDGLVDDEVLLMIFDDNGNLWLGTNKGIGVLDIIEFEKTGKKIFKFYGKDEGFLGIECNQNAVYKDSKGNLWFGTIKGAIKYDQKEDKPNRVEPAVHITNVKLFFERELGLPGDLELAHHQNHLTFNFIGISLTVPEKVRYQVKLEGFDANWSPISRTNFTTYSNLPAGEYAFKVKACNNEGLWNKEPAVYRFRIKPPFWQTWWFYLSGFLAVIVGLYGIIRVRTHSLKKQKRALEEQVQLRTMELEQLNRELEQRVEERTRKLAAASEKLLHAQKMETIGTLASSIAHDLNNILAGIVNYPEMLLMDMPPDSPHWHTIFAIRRSGLKAAAIVQDLLTLARRGVTVTEVVSLNRVISEFLPSPECQEILASSPDIRIKTHLEEDAHNIIGSPVHLSKTLMNLVSNAVEAMPHGGQLMIKTQNHYIHRHYHIKGYHEVKEGNYVMLSVSDTGIGMSEKDMKHIFEPFYTKKKMGKSGTGLGMAVVWGTVQDHNGYITVESSEKKKKGTTFTLYFPATRLKSVKGQSQLTMNQLMGNGESILVVDDVEEQREAASMILKKLKYSVHAVDSGEKAIEYLKEQATDLLVLDMIMEPGISGLETYKRVLQIYPGQKTIIVTGYTETKDIKEAQKLGAGTYVKKPYDLEKLGIAVKDELEKIQHKMKGE